MKTNATYFISSLLFVVFSLVSLVNVSRAQDTGMHVRMAAVQAVEGMLMNGQSDLDTFIKDKLSDTYIASMATESMHAHLMQLRKAVAGAGGLDIARANDDVHLIFSEGVNATVVLQLDENQAGKISYLGLKEKKSPEEMTKEERMNEGRRLRVRAIEGLGLSGKDDQLRDFIQTNLSPQFRSEASEERLLGELRTLREVIAASGTIMVSVDKAGTHVHFRGPSNANVVFRMEPASPHFISALEVDTNPDVSEEKENEIIIEPISWENFEERLNEEEAAGFSGAVLILRDGKVVLHQGYGKASQEKGRFNSTSTVFGIGSTPIDFTRAAVLKQVENGVFKLSDAIDQFYPDVPEDKAGITINQLMTGKSGLPNFHHIPGTDSNYDISWIDRKEAEQRIFQQPLLFTPGEGRSHSHSAFTLLAAIVEISSSRSYADFLQHTFFDPIGMTQTGFYGDQTSFSDDDMAVGYGFEQIGPINNPRHWGPTSWLSMGSGGMVSSVGDMNKWLQAMFSGNYLSQQSIDAYRLGGVVAGSSDRGFLFMYADDPMNTVIFSSNAHTNGGDHASAVAKALMRMVKPEL